MLHPWLVALISEGKDTTGLDTTWDGGITGLYGMYGIYGIIVWWDCT